MNNIQRTLLGLGMVVALVGSLTMGAKADSISGQLFFSGGQANLNGTFATATVLESVTGIVSVESTPAPTGSYAGTAGAPVTFTTPITFNPAQQTITPLWSFTSSGVTYSFDATSMTVLDDFSSHIDLSGKGYAFINGSDQTAGTWSISIENSNGINEATGNFEASANIPAVPEPSTLLLCGAGLLGLGLIGFSIKKKKS